MVTITINGNDINVSDAQAYAINVILGDYQMKHALASSDEDTFIRLRRLLRDSISLTESDMRQIFKATICRNRDGRIKHDADIEEVEL